MIVDDIIEESPPKKMLKSLPKVSSEKGRDVGDSLLKRKTKVLLEDSSSFSKPVSSNLASADEEVTLEGADSMFESSRSRTSSPSRESKKSKFGEGTVELPVTDDEESISLYTPVTALGVYLKGNNVGNYNDICTVLAGMTQADVSKLLVGLGLISKHSHLGDYDKEVVSKSDGFHGVNIFSNNVEPPSSSVLSNTTVLAKMMLPHYYSEIKVGESGVEVWGEGNCVLVVNSCEDIYMHEEYNDFLKTRGQARAILDNVKTSAFEFARLAHDHINIESKEKYIRGGAANFNYMDTGPTKVQSVQIPVVMRTMHEAMLKDIRNRIASVESDAFKTDPLGALSKVSVKYTRWDECCEKIFDWKGRGATSFKDISSIGYWQKHINAKSPSLIKQVLDVSAAHKVVRKKMVLPEFDYDCVGVNLLPRSHRWKVHSKILCGDLPIVIANENSPSSDIKSATIIDLTQIEGTKAGLEKWFTGYTHKGDVYVRFKLSDDDSKFFQVFSKYYTRFSKPGYEQKHSVIMLLCLSNTQVNGDKKLDANNIRGHFLSEARRVYIGELEYQISAIRGKFNYTGKRRETVKGPSFVSRDSNITTVSGFNLEDF